MEAGLVLRVAHLYPDVMNIYGDRGNIIALRYRCDAAASVSSVSEVNVGDPFDPADFDIVLIGGGQDREQRRIADDLVSKGPALKAAMDEGLSALAVCGGFQLFGHRYVDHEGGVIPGIGIFDLEMRHPGPRADRCIGDVVLRRPSASRGLREPRRPHLPRARPGAVRHGHARLRQQRRGRRRGARATRNAIGTYLHGSLLPKNPRSPIALIRLALERRYGGTNRAAPLDDAGEAAAHDVAVGVAGRRSRRA